MLLTNALRWEQNVPIAARVGRVEGLRGGLTDQEPQTTSPQVQETPRRQCKMHWRQIPGCSLTLASGDAALPLKSARKQLALMWSTLVGRNARLRNNTRLRFNTRLAFNTRLRLDAPIGAMRPSGAQRTRRLADAREE